MSEIKPTIAGVINEVDIKALKKENIALKSKVDSLRANNNSYLYSALVRVQTELPIIQKNSEIYGRQKYANLAEVIRVSRPILVKHGLAVTQTFLGDILITRLCHVSGQYIESNLRLIVNHKDEKTNVLHLWGSSISYFRRYAYSSIVGIATDDDTDGN